MKLSILSIPAVFLAGCMMVVPWAAVVPGAAEPKRDSTPAEGKLIVHEWGTFTTFSGSDGVFLDFRPLADGQSDLPGFVLDRANVSRLPGQRIKTLTRGRVRMETPVTYFYTDRVRDVKVSVDFPKGLLTEFYPPVKTMLPAFDRARAFGDGEPVGNSRLDWGTVTLIPQDQLVTSIDDEAARRHVAQYIADRILPPDDNGNHYAQARQTDSALVHVRRSRFLNSPADESHMEKFLFYRGVGNFELPFQATFDDQGKILISNHGQLPMNSAILLHVDGDYLFTATIDQVAAGQSTSFGSLSQVNIDQLSKIVVDALVAEGLYAKEATAMVQTWKKSWFTEQGTRILYMVPPTITDELLPLHVSPQPQETLRVLVGRMEIMSPDVEKQLLEVVQDSAAARLAYNKANEGNKSAEPYQIPESIQKFGRLAEPALVRVSKIARNREHRTEAERLIEQLRANP